MSGPAPHQRLVVLLAAGTLLLPAPELLAQPLSGRTPGGIHYEVSGEGEVLVLVHAFSLDRRMWAGQVGAWEGQFRVIRYDLRGHGLSAPPSAPYRGLDDLRELLDHLGVSEASFIGLSAGAELAVNFALVHPGRVRRLVLAGPGLGGFRAPPMPWFAPIGEALAAGAHERAAALWAASPMMRLHRAVADTARVAGWARENWRLWSYQRLERPPEPPAIDRLGELRSPVLVVVGERDEPHIHEVARLLQAGVRGATLVVVPGAGHLVSLDAPGEFNRLVDRFLAGG